MSPKGLLPFAPSKAAKVVKVCARDAVVVIAQNRMTPQKILQVRSVLSVVPKAFKAGFSGFRGQANRSQIYLR